MTTRSIPSFLFPRIERSPTKGKYICASAVFHFQAVPVLQPVHTPLAPVRRPFLLLQPSRPLFAGPVKHLLPVGSNRTTHRNSGHRVTTPPHIVFFAFLAQCFPVLSWFRAASQTWYKRHINRQISTVVSGIEQTVSGYLETFPNSPV